jgi:endoglucanase
MEGGGATSAGGTSEGGVMPTGGWMSGALAKASAKIDAYHDRGFRNVRIPITWTENIGGDLLVNDANVGDVNRSHARLAVIQQVVDYALSKPGLHVVINAHHETRLKIENRSWVLERLWQDIADIFRE